MTISTFLHQHVSVDDLPFRDSTHNYLFLGGVGILSLLLLNYTYLVLAYHRAHSKENKAKGQLPPHYPFFLPFFGPLLQIWWDHGGFAHRVSSYAGKLTSNRFSVFGHTFYNFQDRETIEKLFKHPALSSSINMYSYVNSYLLGTPNYAMGVYRADDSGPFPHPHAKSNVLPHNRIDHITHHSVFRGLTGPGLQPSGLRFAQNLHRRLDELDIPEDWVHKPDFTTFFREVVGAAALEAILGPAMLRLNPTFVKDIFKFDHMFPTFGPGLPRFMMPESYSFRDGLVQQFKNWYKHARKNYDASQTFADGDGDPWWGSTMMRLRQDSIKGADNQDDESLARVDLGLAWAIIGNVVTSSMFSAFHVFKDKDLLSRVQQELTEHVGPDGALKDVDPHKLGKDATLLLSVYAETLRKYIKVYSVYSTPHEDVDLGKWVLPKGELAILNSDPCHRDENFWNTRDGRHPLDGFWAERFIVDPQDPDSGPINRACRQKALPQEKLASGKPFFSTEGCDGAWIPYGGGFSMCPGRFLAKNIIVYSSAVLASRFDIDIEPDTIAFTKKRYGMGVEDLAGPIPFRIRKRATSAK
ncbi:cytochrome P450 [Apiospora aurea]|uniref:Cytochrome P450 n=1 Tax=Apiospora aurea TaxID=335848 RepID=A0ABR1Q013_9PEZI